MHFQLITPCKNCPFRTDIKAYLKPQRVEEICDSLIYKQQSFPCHKTTKDDDGNTCETPNSQHCAGALIFLEKQDRPNQMMRIAERLGLYNRHKLDMDAPVFDDEHEMIDAQKIMNSINNEPHL